jgi:hypothetical protein
VCANQSGDQERLVLGEAPVVEDEEELAPLLQALDGVRDAGRKVPQVALADVLDEVAPLGIDRSDARASGEHVGPLGLLVPVHLADASRLQAHVDPGQLRRDRQLARGHLASPPLRQKTIVGCGKGELEIGTVPESVPRGPKLVGVLALQRHVARPQSRRTLPSWTGWGGALAAACA